MSNDGAPTFGFWYDFRQETPFMAKHEDFYAERPWIEDGERPGFSSARLSEHHLVDDGYIFEART